MTRMKRGKKAYIQSSADRIVFWSCTALLSALVWLGVSLFQSVQSQKKICQGIVPLGKYSYDARFLEQAKALPGLRSITPICEIPVRLRVEDYVMDTVWTGADLTQLQMHVKQAQDTALGKVPALLIGENSLQALTDMTGHAVSEKRRRSILEQYKELTWQYQLIDGIPAADKEAEGNADSVTGKAASPEGRAAPKDGDWSPCNVAAVLGESEERIYLPYEQACTLQPSDSDVTQILLCVRGEDNYEQALELIRGASESDE